MSSVFISYLRENIEIINRLCKDLNKYRIDFWIDRKQLTPGVIWQDVIRQAIQSGDFFMACFSDEYNRRERTYMNEELTIAIEELRLRSHDRSWFIPVLLSGRIPDRDIGGGHTLRSIQYVDLNENTWDEAIQKIVHTIKPESFEDSSERDDGNDSNLKLEIKETLEKQKELKKNLKDIKDTQYVIDVLSHLQIGVFEFMEKFETSEPVYYRHHFDTIRRQIMVLLDYIDSRGLNTNYTLYIDSKKNLESFLKYRCHSLKSETINRLLESIYFIKRYCNIKIEKSNFKEIVNNNEMLESIHSLGDYSTEVILCLKSYCDSLYRSAEIH